MKIKLIAIGNSKGVRIPSAILKQCNVGEQVELDVEDDRIILKSIKNKPRAGWNESFKLMHENKDDILLIGEALDMEFKDWIWK